jgi:hypothetical protein
VDKEISGLKFGSGTRIYRMHSRGGTGTDCDCDRDFDDEHLDEYLDDDLARHIQTASCLAIFSFIPYLRREIPRSAAPEESLNRTRLGEYRRIRPLPRQRPPRSIRTSWPRCLSPSLKEDNQPFPLSKRGCTPTKRIQHRGQ